MDDNYVLFCATDSTIKVLELQKLSIRFKIDLLDENITRCIPSKINKNYVFMASSKGKFMLFDTRSSGEFVIKEQLHVGGIMDFTLTRKEDYALTCSLDKTINLIKLDTLDL